jgi:hypothetical protein
MLQRRIAAALKRRCFALAASLYMALATEALAQVRPDVKLFRVKCIVCKVKGEVHFVEKST